MFKRPLHDLKTSAPLKTSERRKLKQRVLDYFKIDSSATGNEGLGDLLVPDGILSAKFSSHLEEHGVMYLDGHGSSDPLWFTIGKNSTELIPTVYTLWKAPRLLPNLTTPKAVIPKLAGGADLMAPGVVTCPRSLQRNQLVSISEYGTNRAPVAVGTMAMDSDVLGDDTKGKAVLTLHVSGDELWSIGSKTTPPEIPIEQVEQVDEINGESSKSLSEDTPGNKLASVHQLNSSNVESATSPEHASAGTTEPTQDDSVLSPQDVTVILRRSLLQSLKNTVQFNLPIPASTFYSTYILPSRPSRLSSRTPIDIKHSSFKTLSHFLRAASQEGLVKIKDQKSELVVTSVSRDHPDVIAHVSYHTLADAAIREAKIEEKHKIETSKPKDVVVTELWKSSGSPSLTAFFKEAGASPTNLYTISDLRSLLVNYITRNTLPNPTNQLYVRLDPLLNSILTLPSENIEQMRREEMLKKLCSKMQPWYSIGHGEDDRIVRKGQPPMIRITTKQRQGRKIVTCITHFEPFFIDAGQLGEELKLKCASSTAVSPLPGKNTQQQEVMVQGSHISNAVEILMAKGVTKKWIEIADDAAKKK